jgi:branched-subunit amino acid aminotransferase/4-amino-4-deoxychorismate lyase
MKLIMSNYKQYLNGRFVDEKDLLISPRDLGFTRGYGVFEYIRTYRGRPYKLNEHIKRLLNSADLIKLKHNLSSEYLENLILELIEINKDEQDKSIRIHLSGGVSSSMYQTVEPTVIIFMDIFKPKNQDIYTDGVALNTVKYERDLPASKNVNYIEGVRQAHINLEMGIYEPLYYSDKQVFETSNSNIFALKNGILYTPKNNVFYGSARGTIVNNLNRDFKIVEKDFDIDFLFNADEVFLVSGGKQVVPVVKIDNNKIGHGMVGDVSMQVLQKFKEFIELNNW